MCCAYYATVGNNFPTLLGRFLLFPSSRKPRAFFGIPHLLKLVKARHTAQAKGLAPEPAILWNLIRSSHFLTTKSPVRANNMYLICPYCSKRLACAVSEGWNNCVCDSCKKQFTVLEAKVQAKRLGGDKNNNGCRVSVHLLYGDQEEWIEYNCDYHNTLEMRAGDNVLFYFCKKTLYIVENTTIGRYTYTERANYGYPFGIYLIFLLILIFMVGLYS